MRYVHLDDLDLSNYVQPGDRVVCGQGTAEPCALTERLMHDAPAIESFDVFLGVAFSQTFLTEVDATLCFRSYGAIGTSTEIARRGQLEILPCHYSALYEAFDRRSERADVVLIQLCGNEITGFNMGLAHDYVARAAAGASTVIAEINPRVPWTTGAELPADISIDIAVEVDREPLELAPASLGLTEQKIATRVASLIPDGAVLQLGVGSVPEAVLSGLRNHRDLGIHSGVIGDRVMELMEQGVISNGRKSIDQGVSVCGSLFGTRRLYDFVHQNPSVYMRPASYTHALSTMARLNNFIALNSAIEVDLSGQVNAEVANGRLVGAVGGQVDFIRGANASLGGRAIIALPSTAKNGTVSRIVPTVGNVTCARSDVDAIVTEWGVAELRGLGLAARAGRMIEVAAPQFREGLARAAFGQKRHR
ncbi:MAG: acetyl-CoA hydrolase/transferase family protein [Marinobacter sp.]